MLFWAIMEEFSSLLLRMTINSMDSWLNFSSEILPYKSRIAALCSQWLYTLQIVITKSISGMGISGWEHLVI